MGDRACVSKQPGAPPEEVVWVPITGQSRVLDPTIPGHMDVVCVLINIICVRNQKKKTGNEDSMRVRGIGSSKTIL